jgi:glucose dehydrogenase
VSVKELFERRFGTPLKFHSAACVVVDAGIAIQSLPLAMTNLRLIVAFAVGAACASGQTDWPVYGHDPAGTRYSPLKQITAANVAKLQPRPGRFTQAVRDRRPLQWW